MSEQAKIDLALLAGYIIGTHDLKGDDSPPGMLMPIIERAMNSGRATTAPDAPAKPPITNHKNFQVADNKEKNEDLKKEPVPTDTNLGELGPAEKPEPIKVSMCEHKEPGEKKERKGWSDEAKAAASKRALDRGLGKKKEPAAENIQAPIREEGWEIDETVVLDHTDWSSIKRQRDNGLPLVRIAKQYKVELPYLQTFIFEQEARDKRGND